MRLIRVAVCIAVALPVTAGAATGDVYPDKPIRIMATAPGGLTDVAARLIAPGLSANLGQQVVVDNRNAIVAVETAAKAAPDGYTILMNGSAFWLMPLLREKVSWDPAKDFVPITMVVTSPSILVVHPAVPVKTVAELIALAKSKPGTLNYAAGTIGATPHLAAELYRVMTGTHLVRVAYRGSGAALNGLIASQVQIMFPNAGAAMPLV